MEFTLLAVPSTLVYLLGLALIRILAQGGTECVFIRIGLWSITLLGVTEFLLLIHNPFPQVHLVTAAPQFIQIAGIPCQPKHVDYGGVREVS